MSSADKRSVATDALETLGMIHPSQQYRDAIHLAVEPVVAGEVLLPGEQIGFLEDGTVGKKSLKNKAVEVLGIVDPFLTKQVIKGEHFWLVVFPRKIRSLRHVWEHPGFAKETLTPDVTTTDKDISEAWITEFARGYGEDAATFIWHARDYLKHDEYWVEGGRFESEAIPDVFWDHYEVVTGETVPKGERGTFFSCSC